MELIKPIMESINETKIIAALIAALFAIVALVITVPIIIRDKGPLATQLLGSLLVIAISFSAHNPVVYTISVFVIATLVTELQFLEKIAALIWNRKEYWNYLIGAASKEEVESKAKAEAEAELLKAETEGLDEAEAVEDVDEEPEGIAETELPDPVQNSHELMLSALEFEKSALDCLERNKIPFSYNQFKTEVRITSGSRSYVIDGIIETRGVHYLIEVKNIKRPSSLVYAVSQIQSYKTAYENYLNERKLTVAVQPIIIIPDSVNISGQFRGIPIVKFNNSSQEFSNLKSSYADYELSLADDRSEENLQSLLLSFLRKYSKWAFSPLRIQIWGAKQAGYEKFKFYSAKEIKQELEYLLRDGLLEERMSKKRNRLFRGKL